MPPANQPPQPPTINQLDGYRIGVKGKMRHKSQTSMQPLTGCQYPVGVSRVPCPAELGIENKHNQFDEHQNRFFAVIERVRFFDGDGVLTDRIILDVRGLIVQIVAHDDSPRTVIVKIGEDVRMIRRAALIFIFLHLAKRMQHEHAQRA